MHPNIKVCCKCQHFQMDYRRIEDKRRCFLDGPYDPEELESQQKRGHVMDCFLRSARKIYNRPTTVPDECPYTLEHTISQGSDYEGDDICVQEVPSL